MATYYLGMKYGQEANPENVLAGTSSVGATADLEVRLETGNNMSKKGAIELLTTIIAFINGNGQGPGDGAFLPPT